MLQSLSVRNFQSIHKADLTLASFTVIVGQSSSGKSAFTRALRTLVSNARGTAFITHGELACTITAVTDHGSVSLGKGTKDEYRVRSVDGTEKTFTKLGGDVPPEVTAILGIQPKDPINFAGQFDMPYMLKASPSEVARTLGELTNADIIFSASRESNRRRLQSSSALKVKVEDLSDIQERAKGYARLRSQMDELATAEVLLEDARRLATRHAGLANLVSIMQDSDLRRSAAAQDVGSTIPDLTPVNLAQSRLETLTTLLGASASQKRAVDDAREAIEGSSLEIAGLEQRYLDELHAMGTCPTCGASTGEVGQIV